MRRQEFGEGFNAGLRALLDEKLGPGKNHGMIRLPHVGNVPVVVSGCGKKLLVGTGEEARIADVAELQLAL